MTAKFLHTLGMLFLILWVFIRLDLITLIKFDGSDIAFLVLAAQLTAIHYDLQHMLGKY